MRRIHERFPPILALAIAGVFATHAGAQSSGGAYRVDRVVVAGGGGTTGAAPYELLGTFGQSATTTLSAAGYRLDGGFWAAGLADPLFVDGFED